jgi:NADH dehydrogenase (ubiquinone) Fe-S protein 6
MLNRCARPSLNGVLKSLPRFASTSVTPSKTDAKVSNPEVSLHQAPNYPTTSSTSQRPRPGLHSGPRFEQTDMALQPNPLSAMELIAQEPIRLVQGRKAVCDGGQLRAFLSSYGMSDWDGFLGGGPLGHPKIYINLVWLTWPQTYKATKSVIHWQDQSGPRACG